MRRNSLNHTATHCITPQHMLGQVHLVIVMRHNTLQHTATHCNTLQHTATHLQNVFGQVHLAIVMRRPVRQRYRNFRRDYYYFCACTYFRTPMHTYIHVCIRKCIRINIHMYVYITKFILRATTTSVVLEEHTYIHEYSCKQTHTRTRAHTNTCKHM